MINSLPTAHQSQKLHLVALIALCFITLQAKARVRDFETTRLISTGGAGIGSINLNESVILNPAPIAFFNSGIFYIQRSNFDYEGGQGNRVPLNKQFSEDSKNTGIIIADTKNVIKGALSYQQQEQRNEERKRFSGSFARAVGKKSAAGLIVSHTDENVVADDGTVLSEDKYQQYILGFTHALSKEFTLGLTAVDLLRTKDEDSHVAFGTQYVIKDILTLMADIGADYDRGLSETLFYKLAGQINIFADIYIRAGLFNSKLKGEKGEGAGIAWVGPKLHMELAMRRVKNLDSTISSLEGDETLRETAFSLAYRF